MPWVLPSLAGACVQSSAANNPTATSRVLLSLPQVREGDAWQELRTMEGILKALVVSLEQASEAALDEGPGAEGRQRVVKAFADVASVFSERFKKFNDKGGRY